MRITGMRMASAALVLLGLVGLVRAEEKRQVATPAVETFTKYVRLDVELPKALRDDKSVTLHLGGGGEAGFHQAWATAEGVKVISDAVDATGLVLKDGKLKGTVEIADLRDGSEAGLAAEFTIDGTVDGGKVRGSYSGWRAVRELGTDNI
ncbi:MAG: hypothetical protein ACOCVI_03415, partial [Planctomycetota bacterium]